MDKQAASNKADRWFIFYRTISGILGWVWLLSIPLTLALTGYAAFFDGPWKYALFSFIAGGVGKWLCLGFREQSERVSVEAYLMIERDISKSEAGYIWLELYQQGGAAKAKQVVDFDDEQLAEIAGATQE